MDAARERVVSDLKGLLEDVEALLGATAGQAGETVSAVRERIARRLEEGKRSLREAEELLLGRGREAAQSAETYVRDNPWTAVGMAAGAGLVIGLLIRRK
jgi:ElaB/YqjD/DUF883 family membrane-anchored ribosome-binding protein